MSLSQTLRTWARGIKREGVTLWFAYKHPDTPLLPRLLCMLVVAYALSPIDLIPDFIPVLGYLDDVILLPCLIWLTIRMIPPHVLIDSRKQADAWMEKEGKKPRSNWGIVLVIGLWLLASWLLWAYWLSHYFSLEPNP